MTDDERAAVHARVLESRARQHLNPTVSDEAGCSRIARLLRPLNTPAPAGRMAVRDRLDVSVGVEHPEHDGAPSAASSVLGASSELGVARDAAYPIAATP